MLNLESLNTFLIVAEYGSFSEVARRLNLTQPAVSQTIQNLERDLGVELFSRQGKSIRLTEAGQMLRPLSAELLNNARRVRETMTSLHGEVYGEMNIGCSTTSGKYLLPGLIARFRETFPHVRVNVLVTSRDSVVRRLLSGEIPLGVSSKLLEHKDLEYREFFSDDVILVAPAGHRWAGYRRVFPDDLLDEPLILREEAAGTYEVLMQGLQKRDITPDMLNVAMVIGNAEAIEMAVEEGIGVAFISRLAARRGLELGNIVEISVEGLSLSRQIFIVRNRRLPLTKSQSEFWNFVNVGMKEPA